MTLLYRRNASWQNLYNFGLEPLHPPAPNDLYDVISQRYEQSSILLTSNRDPNEWPDWFGASLLASAGLDRLTHGANIIVITDDSFRARGNRHSKEEVSIEP
ncbi:MAG: ATP-binding protein [Chloroflexi bacterium]|nr:ATP-binding protein [Chloroflexota bacterium]